MQAQNDSRAGVWAILAPAGWKPSYGVYFEADSAQDKNFIYFADYNNDGTFDNSGGSMDCNGECIRKISITKGNRISDLLISSDTLDGSTPDVSIVFSRTSAEPVISAGGVILSNAEVQITAESPKALKAFITVSASGKLEVK
jgi:hypothetical protein